MKVSRAAPVPLYHQVVNVIRRHIDDGTWAPGERVPSERQLAEFLGVSRITVRHAMRLACQEGILEPRPGVGTFVARPGQLNQDLAEVRTFERTLADQGHVASTDILRSETSMNDLALSGTLQLDPGATLYKLQLLGRGDSTPVVLYDSCFPLELGREMATAADRLHAEGRPFSTLDLYRRPELSRRPRSLSQTIEAMPAPEELAGPLGLGPGEPILAIESLMSDQDGPLEFRRAYYRGDRYKFAVSRPLGRLFPG